MSANFATTQWTLVWRAASEDVAAGRPALAEVIRRYWQPLYSFARRRGFSSEDAEDATQEFLSRMVDGKLLEQANPARGKFRTYLLTAWKRFLIDDYRTRHTQRRGGEAPPCSLDFGAVEKHWQSLQSREPDPDRVFMLAWATNLMEQARERLRQEYEQSGRGMLCQVLLDKLNISLDAAAYCELGRQAGLSPNAVKVALHRLRTRFASSLREVIAETVDSPEEIDAELRELLEVLSQR